MLNMLYLERAIRRTSLHYATEIKENGKYQDRLRVAGMLQNYLLLLYNATVSINEVVSKRTIAEKA